MRNRRPINQKRLRDEPVAFGVRPSEFRPIVKAVNQVCALIKAIGRQVALDASRAGLLTITPSRRVLARRRRIATELRRRDRRRARAGRTPVAAAQAWDFVPPVGLVYVAPVGSLPIVGVDGSVTWLRPDGVENAQPVGYTFDGPTENGERE